MRGIEVRLHNVDTGPLRSLKVSVKPGDSATYV
jgi:hypothetical protein